MKTLEIYYGKKTITEEDIDFLSKDNKEDVEEIILPETLTKIEEAAFRGCVSLKRIDFPESLKVIENDAFLGCPLEEINLNEGLEYIGRSAFRNCDIETIYIPSTVKEIGSGILSGNKNLKEIIVSTNNKIYSDLASNIIYDKASDKIVQGCVNSIIPSEAKIIGINAFSKMPIKEIEIPESVEEIEKRAFLKCNIEKLTLNEGLKNIESWAFFNNNIRCVEIPKSVKTIEDYAFCCCDNLEKVIIKGNTDIYTDVFSDCPSLENISLYGDSNNISKNITDNFNATIYIYRDIKDTKFKQAYEKQIKFLTVDKLIEENKSFKEINTILKKSEEIR